MELYDPTCSDSPPDGATYIQIWRLMEQLSWQIAWDGPVGYYHSVLSWYLHLGPIKMSKSKPSTMDASLSNY